jgi:hypothetical protein
MVVDVGIISKDLELVFQLEKGSAKAESILWCA